MEQNEILIKQNEDLKQQLKTNKNQQININIGKI